MTTKHVAAAEKFTISTRYSESQHAWIVWTVVGGLKVSCNYFAIDERSAVSRFRLALNALRGNV